MPRITVAETRPITVTDIYNRTLNDLSRGLPRGKEFVAFDFPQRGQEFLKLDGTVGVHNSATYKFGGPRLIVATRRIMKYVFTETGDVQVPEPNQYYLNNDGTIGRATMTAGPNGPMPIVVMTQEEVAA